MVPRQSSMLIDSAAAASRLSRWFVIGASFVLCGTGASGCGANTKPIAHAQQKSDLQLSPRSTKSERGWIGIQLGVPVDRAAGVDVIAVVAGSPALAAGISAGDRLLECNARPLQGPEDLVALIRASKPGTILHLSGTRAGNSRSFEVKVEASPDENSVLTRLFVGRVAPSLDGIVAVGGQPAPHWSELRGRVVVLDFWAPWCGVCHLVTDDLNQWQQEFGSALQVIGIATGSPQHVAQFAPRFHMEYLVVADPDEIVSKAFNASAVPMVFVIDRSGVVRAVHLGYSSERMSTMKQLVSQLVSQQ